MGVERKMWYLERGLFGLLPESDMAQWDNCGLLVGDKDADVTCVAVALEPSVELVDRASLAGCNVLLTNQPAFLRAPHALLDNSLHSWAPSFARLDSVEQVVGGEIVGEAMRKHVALMAMNTNLDYSERTGHVLPDKLGLTYLNPIEQTSHEGAVGFDGKGAGLGQLCSTPRMTLAQLARRCRDTFGSEPRVWGDPEQNIELIATCPGSAWPLINDAARCQFDCFVCGEVRYHTAYAALQSGISVIELGYDVSKRMFVDVLCDCLLELGYSEKSIKRFDSGPSWWTLDMPAATGGHGGTGN